MDEPTYRLTAGAVVWAVDEGETLALDLERGSYLGVNSAGTVLWTALERGATHSELVASLQAEYDLSAQRAEADVSAFLAACRARGFLAS